MPNYLIPVEQIRAHLPGYDISDDTAAVASKLVLGWLKTATGNRTLTSPIDDDDELWSDALELLGMVISNPENLAGRTAGPTSRQWPIAPRRDAILANVRVRARRAAGAPQGVFPPPQPWPDRPIPSASPWWCGW